VRIQKLNMTNLEQFLFFSGFQNVEEVVYTRSHFNNNKFIYSELFFEKSILDQKPEFTYLKLSGKKSVNEFYYNYKNRLYKLSYKAYAGFLAGSLVVSHFQPAIGIGIFLGSLISIKISKYISRNRLNAIDFETDKTAIWSALNYNPDNFNLDKNEKIIDYETLQPIASLNVIQGIGI